MTKMYVPVVIARRPLGRRSNPGRARKHPGRQGDLDCFAALLRNFRQPTLLPPLAATRPGQPSASMLLIGVLACAVPPLVTSPLTGTILANGLLRHHCKFGLCCLVTPQGEYTTRPTLASFSTSHRVPGPWGTRNDEKISFRRLGEEAIGPTKRSRRSKVGYWLPGWSGLLPLRLGLRTCPEPAEGTCPACPEQGRREPVEGACPEPSGRGPSGRGLVEGACPEPCPEPVEGLVEGSQ
jgi:hypothetical protein